MSVFFCHKIQNYRAIDSLIFLTASINVLIPKAGFKIGGIPLTLGNIFLFLLLIRTYIKPFRIKVTDRNFMFLFLLYPFYCFLRIFLPLIAGTVSISEALPLLAANSVYPLIFPVLIMKIKNEDQFESLTKIIMTCLFLTMLYDIAQIIFGVAAVQIPGITVNYSDYASAPNSWWLAKANGFENASKFFSTYQNGNVYGLNLLMFYPLFSLYFRQNKGIFSYIMLIALFSLNAFLTGSRTVWLGTIIYTFLLASYNIKRDRINLKNFLASSILLSLFCFYAYDFVSIFSGHIGRFFNSLNSNVFFAGAGRTEGAVRSFKWLFENGNVLDFLFGVYGTDGKASAGEMTYFAILFAYGITGLVLWLLPIICVSLRIKQKSIKTGDMFLLGAYRGIFLYMACAFIEGAFWLPPTVINLWTLIALAYKKLQFKHS